MCSLVSFTVWGIGGFKFYAHFFAQFTTPRDKVMLTYISQDLLYSHSNKIYSYLHTKEADRDNF